uniref:Uncharacterized protein n=1 Tax=Steinernema glaseri TaxID=37863 RepID=A0A1I7ZB40_9BILA
MDTVPYAFVVSLMETFLTIDDFRTLGELEELGCGYSKIVRQVYEATTSCTVNISGVFFKAPFNEDRFAVEAPVFKGIFRGDKRSPPVMKNLDELSVLSRSLFFEGNKNSTARTSMREIRRLMERCQRVRVRELVIKHFPSAAVPRHAFAFIPNFTTFFNRVVLSYHDTDTFREFFLAFVEAKKLLTLRLDGSLENGFPSVDPPLWLQETIVKAFFQPQLRELKIFFDHSWASHVLFDFLLREWLRRSEAFSETTKVLEISKAPPFHLLVNSFRSTGEVRTSDEYYFARRRFLLPHPESVERTLEVEVFTRSNEKVETLRDDEFLEKATHSRIRFHFNRGQNAMYWRTLRTTPITKKRRLPWSRKRLPQRLTHCCKVLAAASPYLLTFLPSLIIALI